MGLVLGMALKFYTSMAKELKLKVKVLGTNSIKIQRHNDIDSLLKYKSLNEDRTTFTHFHRIQDGDNLLLRLSVLIINDYETKRLFFIKRLEVLIDEHLSWPELLNILENKLLKSLGLLYN